jgi:hypothetical protein
MKKFIWCSRSSDKVSCIKGPDKKEWQKLIGFSYIHSLEDLCKLPISDVLKYRLDTAAEGVIIGIHHLHTNVDLAVRRLSDNEIETMQLEKKLSSNLADVVKQIAEKTPALHVQKKEIETQLSIARQKIREMNLEGVDP